MAGDRFDMGGDFRDGNLFLKPSVNVYQLYQQARPTEVDPARLADANARLAELPLDTVPDPAPLPAGSCLPQGQGRNPLFVGRADDLKALAAALKAGETAAVGQIAAATGLGGIGKTQLANEFVHRYGQFFAGGVFWLSFADPEAIPAEVAACGEPGAGPLDEQLRVVLARWQSPLPRLLVFDNCEDEALLAAWRPPTGGSRVLVTSRRAEWSRALGVHALQLGALSRGESVDLLRGHRPDLVPDDPDLDAIAEELGDLPLALHLAGSYLERYQYAEFGRPGAYLAELRRAGLLEHHSLTAGGYSPTGHEQHVARSFAISYDRLQPDDPTDAVALALLARAACFAPGEPIPRDLLRASLRPAEEDDAEAELGAEDALGRLGELGLLETRAAGAVVLHRLVAAFARREADEGMAEAQAAVEEAVFATAARLNRDGYPAPLLAWQPHLRAVTEAAAARGSEQAGVLSSELGYHLRMIADFAGARAAYERALAIVERALGPEHPDVASLVNNLGSVLQALGDLTEARAAFERALAAGERTLGPDHPSVAVRVSNLGNVLQELGDLAGARAAYERALRIDEAVLGPDRPALATDVNNLGSVLKALGELAAARRCFQRALRIDEAALGPNHPNVARDLNNLGSVLRDLGELAGARAAVERALRIDEAAFGPEHPNVAIRVNNLGSVLRAQRDLAGARAAYERALRTNEAAFGPEHPRVASAVSNLGGVLQDLGDLSGARAAYERALRIDEAAFGPDHPNVAIRVNNLGSVLHKLGELAGARAAYERALRIFERALGPEHPRTRIPRDNIAALNGHTGGIQESNRKPESGWKHWLKSVFQGVR